MSRRKIDFGIDLGTTNSAIAKMHDGEPLIIKSMPMQKDTTPSCVAVSRRGSIVVGDKAHNQLVVERKNATINSENLQTNSYIEFKRTMGTDKKYPCSILDKEFTSEELSAEVLKMLKNYVTDEDVHSAVITVPAKFTTNQKDATRRAGKLAGFKQCELLQEPIAASVAYGMKSKKKDGFWIVFDFGGGTFDVALMKAEEGIIKVIDTEGDNHLGGKNLDHAILDEIILPYFKENYSISDIFSDPSRKNDFRNMWKQKVEEAKIQLSMQDSIDLMTDLGENWGIDDEGNEFELDLVLERSQLNKAIKPVFQRAINLTKELLERNNLTGADLLSLILIGGPTYTPVLRQMLREQICEVDTSVDPMTAVAKGAALYASTLDLEDEIIESSKDLSKVQLDLTYESTSVEELEFVTVKLGNQDASEYGKLFVEFNRKDGGWSSGKFEVTGIGDVIEVRLQEDEPNLFKINLYDDLGNKIPVEPDSFTIIQGSKTGSATLPYHYGFGIADLIEEKEAFQPIPGLERNKSLPAVGTYNALKTQKDVRPGNSEDVITIPIYQGENNAEGTRAIHNELVYEIEITGKELPGLLPANSDVDLTLKVDRSESLKVEAYYPYLDHTTEIEVPTDRVQKEVDSEWLKKEISTAKAQIQPSETDLYAEVEEIEKLFSNYHTETERKKEVLDRIRKVYRSLDDKEAEGAWPKLEKELREKFSDLEDAQQDLGNEKSASIVNDLRNKLNQVIISRDLKLGKALLREINAVFFELTRIYQLIGLIRGCHADFESIQWSNRARAKDLIQQGLQIIGENPTADRLGPVGLELIELLPQKEKSKLNSSLLTK